MKSNPREDILLPPQFSILEFGDAFCAQIKPGSREYKDCNGYEWIKLTIHPGEGLIKKYNIKPDELDINGDFVIQIKKVDYIPLNLYDDTNRTFLYTKNFRGEDTDLSKRYWELTNQVEEYQNKLAIIEAWMIAKSEELMLSETNAIQSLSAPLELFNKLQNMGMANLVNQKPGEQPNV
jgi:hypothetical protein